MKGPKVKTYNISFSAGVMVWVKMYVGSFTVNFEF